MTLLRDSSIAGGRAGAVTSLSLQEITTGASLVSGGSVSLDNGSYTGSITAGTTVTAFNGASYDASSTYEAISTSFPTIPTRSVSCLSPSGTNHNTGGGTLNVSPGDPDQYTINNSAGQVVLSGPGDYSAINFNANGALVFGAGGTYTFDDLNITAGNPKILFPPGEKVTIETCTGLTFQNGALVSTYSRTTNACMSASAWDGSRWWYGPGTTVRHNGNTYIVQAAGGHDPHTAAYQPGVGASWSSVWTDLGPCSTYSYSSTGTAPNPFEVEWYTNSSSTVTLGPGALGTGVLIAPYATVAPQAGTFNGAIYAQAIAGQTDFHLDATGLTGAPCESAGIAPPAGGTCPVLTVPPLLKEPCVTGRDCQVNHRCVEPETGPSCAHSKCSPGVALQASCDECVERICAGDPSCCTDGWDASCIAQVASVCDATCDDYSCLHQACETGAPLEPSCDSCIATVCATSGFEDCCTDTWSFKCVLEFRDECGAPPVVTEPTAGGSICDYSAYGRFELQAQGATMTGGWVGSPSSSAQNIAYSQINGNATSSGSLNAYGSVVSGDLLSGSGSVAYGTVLGSVITGVPPSPVLPTKTLTGCGAGADPRSGNLAPGTYGDVTVADGQTLRLAGGTYTFNSLTVGTLGGTGGRLALPSDGSMVEINVCQQVDFMSNSVMSGLTQATAMNVSLYAEGYIAAHGSNTLYGLILSVGSIPYYSGPCFSGDPCNLSLLRDASVYMGPGSTVYGIVGGERRLDIRGGSLIDSTGLEDMCQLTWDPGTTVTWPGCPVSLTPNLPDESAVCLENLSGYEDATCGGYDLALGIPCDREVPVCNHGTLSYSGTVEVGYWAMSSQILSDPSPSSPDGLCSGALTIPAGECAPLSCGMIPSGEHTLMVDPSGVDSECDDRRLDNWTVLDERSCSLPPRVEIQRYEAVCPDNSSPRWGLLTWATSTPGTSTITFSGVTAPTDAAFPASPTYQLLGTAQSGTPDTQDCLVTGPSPPCPIDLTAEFGLGQIQDPFLELRIELSGSDMPVLEDWRITYSCIVDQ